MRLLIYKYGMKEIVYGTKWNVQLDCNQLFKHLDNIFSQWQFLVSLYYAGLLLLKASAHCFLVGPL